MGSMSYPTIHVPPTKEKVMVSSDLLDQAQDKTILSQKSRMGSSYPVLSQNHVHTNRGLISSDVKSKECSGAHMLVITSRDVHVIGSASLIKTPFFFGIDDIGTYQKLLD